MSENYVGVKFEVVYLPKEKVSDPRILELIKTGRELARSGFCPGNSGNLSFRYALGFVTTRAGSELRSLFPEDFVLVTDVNVMKGKVYVAGKAEPSSEAIMHFLIYKARPDVNAILHAHALHLKNAVETKKAYPYATLEFANSAVEALKDHDLVVLKDHGFVSVGETIAKAFRKIS